MPGPLSRVRRFAHRALICALLALGMAGRATADDGEAAIAQSYRDRDAAYGRSDAERLISSLAPSVVVREAQATRTLDKAQQLEAARYQVRGLAGKMVSRRESTQIASITGTGQTRTVTGTVVQQMDVTDRGGTKGHVVRAVRFTDTWSLLGEGWRQTATQLALVSRNAAGAPAPEAVAALGNMRRTIAVGNAALANLRGRTQMLQDFNAANNFSYCMSPSVTRSMISTLGSKTAADREHRPEPLCSVEISPVGPGRSVRRLPANIAYAVEQAEAGTPVAVYLRPGRFRMRRLLTGSAFVIGLVLLPSTGQVTHKGAALTGAIFFGCCVLVDCVLLLPRAAYLKLDADGFTWCWLFRKKRTEWTDVSDFEPAFVGGRPMVAYLNRARSAPGHCQDTALPSGGWRTQFLPDTFGLAAEELAGLMNWAARRRAS